MSIAANDRRVRRLVALEMWLDRAKAARTPAELRGVDVLLENIWNALVGSDNPRVARQRVVVQLVVCARRVIKRRRRSDPVTEADWASLYEQMSHICWRHEVVAPVESTLRLLVTASRLDKKALADLLKCTPAIVDKYMRGHMPTYFAGT